MSDATGGREIITLQVRAIPHLSCVFIWNELMVGEGHEDDCQNISDPAEKSGCHVPHLVYIVCLGSRMYVSCDSWACVFAGVHSGVYQSGVRAKYLDAWQFQYLFLYQVHDVCICRTPTKGEREAKRAKPEHMDLKRRNGSVQRRTTLGFLCSLNLTLCRYNIVQPKVCCHRPIRCSTHYHPPYASGSAQSYPFSRALRTGACRCC